MAIDEARKAELLGESVPPETRNIRPETAHVFAAKKTAQSEHIRESWVRAMEARIVQQNLQKCYRIEGVNHFENCRLLADRYMEMLKENKVCRSRHRRTPD